MHPKTRARRGALAALVAVDSRDAILNVALDTQELPQEAIPFAREIATGVLRHRALIDYTLEPLLKKPLKTLDPPVRAALRLATYESAFLQTRVSAVADEYAEATRAAKLVSAVAFVNAVARRLPPEPRQAEATLPQARQLAIQYSHPEWLVKRWLARFGFEECARLLQANNERAPLSLRVNTRRVTREQVKGALSERGLAVRDGQWSRDALLVENAGSPLGWPEWTAGQVIAQDEAAQLVVQYAAVRPGWFVLDAAAAPGGKTTYLAQLMGSEGKVLACDLAPGRLKLVRDNAERLGLSGVETRAGDLRELAKNRDGEIPDADLLLLDAPCLGTGTLRRRPDAKWKKTPEHLTELGTLQTELLDAAATMVKKGGVFVYSTCSLEPEENAEQALSFVQRHPNFRIDVENDLSAESRGLLDENGFLHTMPHRHGCDGTFAARFRRIE